MSNASHPTLRDLRPARKRFNPEKHFSGETVANFLRAMTGALLRRCMYYQYSRCRYKTDVLKYTPEDNSVEVSVGWHTRYDEAEHEGVVLSQPQLAGLIDLWIPPADRLAAASPTEVQRFFATLAWHYADRAVNFYCMFPRRVALPEHITANPCYLRAAKQVIREAAGEHRWRAMREMGVDIENLDLETQAFVVESRLIDA